MTNPVLDNKIENTEVILWQYDQAWNLIRLIEEWNKWARVSCQYFWDRFWGNNETFEKGTFFIDQADTFGLNLWGRMLGIIRPQITGRSGDVQFISDDLYRRLLKSRFFLMNHKPTVPNYNKYLAILFGVLDGDGNIVYDDWSISPKEYKGKKLTLRWGDYSEQDGPHGWFVEADGSQVSDYTGEFDDTSLAIDCFFGEDGQDTIVPIVATREISDSKIFNCYGEPNVDDNGNPVANPYSGRCKVLDFQNMTMGFTFPKNASDEEAYLIFQHYDTVYPFPAGIRYPGEFIYDNLVIGLNTKQTKILGEWTLSPSEVRGHAIDIVWADYSQFGGPSGWYVKLADEEGQCSDFTGNIDSETLDLESFFYIEGEDIQVTVHATRTDTHKNQNYRNFVNGLVLAEDEHPANPNGGIFSTTDRANYKIPADIYGTAYAVNVDLGSPETPQGKSILLTNDTATRQALWIDWGNGDSSYYYIPAGAQKTIRTTYKESGLYAVVMLRKKDSGFAPNLSSSSPWFTIINTYPLQTT